MATATIMLPPLALVQSDNNTNNVICGITRRIGTQSTKKVTFMTLDFDGAGSTAEHAWWGFSLPADYISGGTLLLHWMANATSGNVKWQALVSAVTPLDADTPLEHAFGAVASATDAVSALEARRLLQSNITLNMDGAVARDSIELCLYRDPSDAADTCSVDAELKMAWFEYVY